MTDAPQPSDTDEAFAALMAQYRDHARRIADLRPGNKDAVFDALARAGVTYVIVRFDGYGDSGQIECIEASAADAPMDLPSDNVQFAEPVRDGDTVETTTLTLRDAIEKLAYDALEETHGGWENNDGAYGDFTFDVADRTITLAYNERHMESDYSEHIF